MKKLEGKRALVTGAVSRDRESHRGAASLLKARWCCWPTSMARRWPRSRSSWARPASTVDVSRKVEIDALFDQVASEWKSLDILVNNAGVTHAAELLDLKEEDFDRVLPAINLKSALFATQRAARLMQRGACIINMSSVNALLAIPTQIPYAISKGTSCVS